MDCTKLQQALADLAHLLPLQQDWFTRLLFQLSFNDIETIQTLGATGSGKSTLALALAELLSEQFNVALLTAVPEKQAITAIQQQWFGHQVDATDFTAQINQYTADQELCLIIDDGQDYSAAFMQLLTSLSVRCFIFATKPVVPAALTLTINQAGPEDAQQLLAAEELSSEQLAQRLARAQGNLHYLLQDITAEKSPKLKVDRVQENKPRLIVMFSIAIVAILIAGLVIGFQQFYATHQPKITKQNGIENVAELALVPEHSVIATTSGLPSSTDNVDTEISKAYQPQDTTEPSKPLDTIELAELNNTINTAALIEDNVSDQVATKSVKAVSKKMLVTDNDTAVSSTIDASKSQSQSSALEPATAAVVDANQQLDVSLAAEVTETTEAGCHEPQLIAASNTASALQLAVLSNPAAFKRFYSRYPKLDMLCYQRSWQGKSQVVVLLGPFTDPKQALAARKNLPTKLAESGSFVKSIKAVQAEITAFNVSQQLSTVD
ncbi:SPOR domain-containing protein [Rheinheimera salexigens]|uniref:SPOR domain-containing protein n=1 Tax=Rheinheimera salexigens TaxID=1628148 RepID=A0A1E7Q4L0_9GAMM|nr:SPOR domain-containing protein [Rheinheimera salexigens]OEY69013.1 hypothetical protein BI198_05090 [Rheinheimera salexigens]